VIVSKREGLPVRELLAVLRRKLLRRRPAATEASSQCTLSGIAPDDPANYVFTLGNSPPGGNTVEYFTLGPARENEARWLEMIYRVYNIRFASEAKLQPPPQNDSEDLRGGPNTDQPS
jgi:hypothetical protein